ncbi:polysaccharide biosynthesis C-terminal domain-containing protein [Streptomyces sp. CA-288835]|uniref:lipopolysaccharide biosynthesis protein n=1 Tax=Streptomyces sp. CA-288835 TaxID=3240069 RepID=UPI003D921BE5
MTFNTIAQAAPMVTYLALTPYLIGHLGVDRFGVWSLITIFVFALSVLDGGVGASLARFYAFYGAKNDREGTGRLIIGSLTVFLILGILVTTASLVCAPTVVAALSIPEGLSAETQQLLLLLGPLVTLALASNSATALLQAHARFRGLAAVSAGSCAAYAVGVMLLIDRGGDLPLLALLAAGRYMLLLFGGLCLEIRHIRIRRPLLPDATTRRDFGGYALRMQLSGITVFVNLQIDALVIAAMLPVRYVGIYAVGAQVADALRNLPMYAFPPMLTRMTRVYAKHGLTGAAREFHALQSRWLPSVLTYGVVTTVAVGIAVQVWLGTGFALSGAVAAILTAGYVTHVTLTGMRTCFVRAIGRPGYETRYSWCVTAVNLALTVPLAMLFGVVGVVLATAISHMAGSVYFVVLCRRLAGLRERPLPRRWLPATMLGAALAGLGDLLILRLGWHGVPALLLAGLPILVGLAVASALVLRDLTQSMHTLQAPETDVPAARRIRK